MTQLWVNMMEVVSGLVSAFASVKRLRDALLCEWSGILAAAWATKGA